ncbi:MAG: MarR family transcriptional regulator [Myxococcales bacterium]|nr:MarR family transcriptional regulator [Myxococcales bacterium]
MASGARHKKIGYQLKRLQSLLRARMDAALDERGLTTPQYAALSAIEAAPGLSNAALARRSFVTPQTMIRILDKLLARGLIVRASHPEHGRVLQTTLTARGARLVARCHAGVDAVERQLVAPLDAAERGALLDALERCASALE